MNNFFLNRILKTNHLMFVCCLMNDDHYVMFPLQVSGLEAALVSSLPWLCYIPGVHQLCEALDR